MTNDTIPAGDTPRDLNVDPARLRLAWQIAQRLRGCPPERILREDAAQGPLAEHLAACPWCAEDREALLELDLLPPETAEVFPHVRGDRSADTAMPGEVRRFKSETAGWGPRARFYNPPLVLVLDLPRRPQGAVRVAQLFDQPLFMGPGDVELGRGLIAEAWNTYTVWIRDLDPPVLVVEASRLEQVISTARDMLTGGMALQADSTDSARRPFVTAFRRLEVETAAFFSGRALEDLLEAWDGSFLRALEELTTDKDRLADFTGRFIEWPAHCDDVLEALVSSPWRQDALPRAADGPSSTLFARIVDLRSEQPSMEAVAVELTVFEPTADGFLVGGRISRNLPPGTEIFCLRETAAGKVSPVEAALDAGTGFFRILFPPPKDERMRPEQLKILLGIA